MEAMGMDKMSSQAMHSDSILRVRSQLGKDI